MSYTPLANDTIAAISTSYGIAGVGIIRISGPDSKTIADRLFRPSKKTGIINNRHLHHGYFIDPSSGSVMDEILLSYMKAPHSYTREDVVEINSHSGPVLLSMLLQIVINQGVRLAEPGEFTFRAYINGRIDLTQAEAVMDLVNAKSERGLILTSRQLKGDLGEKIKDFQHEITNILAMTEAAIDFPEEEAEILPREQIIDILEKTITSSIDEIISAYSGRKVWMEGIDTVIAGRVNAGKSSILNRFLNEEKAIVTPVPGTTRDVIETTIYIKGIPLRLMDTAGIREGRGEIERIGIELSKKKLEEADLVLAVIDQSRPLNDDDKNLLSLINEKDSIIILNKNDLPSRVKKSEIKVFAQEIPITSISALTGDEIDTLRNIIADKIIDNDMSAESTIVPNLRHKKALSKARDYFNDAVTNLKSRAPMEIISVDLKGGLENLETITGESAGDELYDSIFSQFCLGK
ncbi:tRNA uridine-5-carboxymethylaminomethyl(34) synthesis GTPase MnmE [Thermodesulfobacteriota bacterium]